LEACKYFNPILEAKGSGHVGEIPVPADVDMRYALLIRNLPHSSADISAPALAYVAS
jgi:putative protease